MPATLDPLVVDYPARLAQGRSNLAIAIAAVLQGKLDNIGSETLLHCAGRCVEGCVENLSHFRLAEQRPAPAHEVMAALIC